MRRRPLRAALACALALAACTPAPKPEPRYVVGAPYSLGGLWSYPQEDFARVETGLAAVLPARSAGLTANGEARDATALEAAHRTLQMPAIVTVTNLENGLSLRVRVNDRGPEQAGRVIGLSPRAATLLGVPAGGAAQVRVEVDGEASRALAAGLPTTERRGPEIAAAPRGEVLAESLEPPPGARAAAPRAVSGLPQARAAEAEAPAAPPPARLPEELRRGAPNPGRLVLEVGSFHRADLARQRAARLGARVEAQGRGRQASYRVVMGPFASVAEADRAVAGVLAAGLQDLRLVVE